MGWATVAKALLQQRWMFCLTTIQSIVWSKIQKKKKMNINIRIYRQRSLKTQTLPHTSRVEAMIARGLFGMNLYMFFLMKILHIVPSHI